MKVVTVSQAAEMDRTAIEEFSLPEILLMENAAGAACRVISENCSIEGTNFLLLCGSGNNGGDGMALARHLYSAGGAPLVLLLSSPDKLNGSASANYKILENYPIEIISGASPERVRRELEETDIVIDALLGTGLSRLIGGDLARIIEMVNLSDKKVFSIDIPTGINGDTGCLMGAAINADFTTAFGAIKPGNILYPGYGHNGRLSLSRISFPPEIYDSSEFQIELNICPPLPPRVETGHKKSFGNTLTISGSSTYFGAPLFAASAVLKCGGGFSRLATPRTLVPVLAAQIPEAVFLPMKETEQGSISLDNISELLREADRSDCVVMGPGLSLNSRTSELICRFLQSFKNFIVLDGDALSAVAGKYHLFEKREIHAVLTPHAGEMARLCACTVDEIKTSPLEILRRCSRQYNSIVILKGPHSLIGLPDGKVYINVSGNSGMGTAGSGDILAGMIGGLFGSGLSAEESARTAVFLHGAAGDMAAKELGRDGLTATDILRNTAPAVKEFRENYRAVTEKYQKIIHPI